MHHRDHRQARRRQAREIVEQAAAGDEALDLVGEQIGAARFDELHERQLVLERDFLAAHDLAPAERAQGARAYARIVRDHHAAHAGRSRRCRRAPLRRGCCSRDRHRRCSSPPGSRVRGKARPDRATAPGARAATARCACRRPAWMPPMRRRRGLPAHAAARSARAWRRAAAERFRTGDRRGSWADSLWLGSQVDHAIMPCSRRCCAAAGDGAARSTSGRSRRDAARRSRASPRPCPRSRCGRLRACRRDRRVRETSRSARR